MKKLYTLLLMVAAVASASAQSLDFKFKNEGDNQWNNLPTKEISKISHTLDASGNGIVNVAMKSGSTHVYGTEAIEQVVNTPAEDLSAYNNGDLLEINNDQDWSVDTTFFNVMCLGTGVYTYFKTIAKINNTKLRYSKSLFFPFTLHYHLYDFTYVSTDYDGNKIKLSGRMFYPYGTDSRGNSLKLSKVFLENHYTTLQNSQSPTSSFENQQLAGMCTKGYLVIEPDYLGFGATKSRSQLFVDQQLLSRHVVDCLKAAMQLKEKVNSDDSYVNIPIDNDAPLLNEGVSQGASVAVGVHRYIENNLTEEERKAIPTLEETRACAGPYNPYLTVEKYAEWDSLYYCATLPMLVQGMAVNHSDLLVDDEGTPIPVRAFFSEKLNNTRYPLFNNYTVWEMLESKNYNSGHIMYVLWSTFGSTVTQKASLYSMLNPELIKDGALDINHPYVKALKRVLDLSDNSEGWSPQAKLKLWHGPNDNIVPYECSTLMYNNIIEENPSAPITFTKLNDDPSWGHTYTCAIWMIGELLGIDSNLVIEVLKTLSD